MSKAKCLSCDDVIESKHRHDFVKCKCGESFLDGGDDYIRGGGNLGIWEDEQFLPVLQRDPELEKCLQDIITDDMFDDGSMDDDIATFNLGYQAGAMDERDRILEGIQKLEYQSHATRTPLYQETMFTKIREILNGTA